MFDIDENLLNAIIIQVDIEKFEIKNTRFIKDVFDDLIKKDKHYQGLNRVKNINWGIFKTDQKDKSIVSCLL